MLSRSYARCVYRLIFALALTAVSLATRATAELVPSGPETVVQYLSGRGYSDAVQWEFFCTEGRRSGEWSHIRVPSCWEQEGFGTYIYGRGPADLGSTETGKYRTHFKIPAELRGRAVHLVFEAASTDTDVWVNGQSAGPTHQGGFYQFRYDISPLVRWDAENVLEVSVRRDSANQSINRAERWGDFWNFSGIFRPVYLEIAPAISIERLAIDAKAGGELSVDVFAAKPATDALQIKAEVLDANGQAVGPVLAGSLIRGQNRLRLNGKWKKPALWTAETPNLYRLRVALFREGEPQHVVTQRFGFRTVEVRKGDGIYVNGQKVILKGANRHSFHPIKGRTLDVADSYGDIALLKEMNMNAVRMSHYPPDPHFLDACDEKGLYVLDELTGWQAAYDTEAGRRLVGELIRRDVNHPSIVFWDNGNEGGWNTELDDDYAKWDPQGRAVLHPWELFRGIHTGHYKTYAVHTQLCAGPDIYMPTEFLHGLYDGGIGAGLWDFWKAMKESPTCAGGFFWALVDEGVARTDRDGRIDNSGNLAPDGIVGPFREREASFYTVKELWSPVELEGSEDLPANFDGALSFKNNYAFTDLRSCRFSATLVQFAGPRGASSETGKTLWSHEYDAIQAAPGQRANLQLGLPKDWRNADALLVTAKGPAGEELWTWSWLVGAPGSIGQKALAAAATTAAPAMKVTRTDSLITVEVDKAVITFDAANGQLEKVQRGRAILPLTAGPRLSAYRLHTRSFVDIAPASVCTAVEVKESPDAVTIVARYQGGLRQVRWTIQPTGHVKLDYEYAYTGEIDILGVRFELPDTRTEKVRWLGKGPYRVWQNRIHGARFGVWENENEVSVPGQIYHYPEFAGYYRDWQWARFKTTDGKFAVASHTPGTYLGVLRPHDGTGGLYDLPDVGLGFFDVIPAMRNKFHRIDELGPQSLPKKVDGAKQGTVEFDFSE
jgi:hypothetical protein